MSKADRLKEEIGWLKLYFGLFFAVDVSLIAWLAQHLHTANTALIAAALIAILTVSGVLAFTYRRIYTRFDQLEKLR